MCWSCGLKLGDSLRLTNSLKKGNCWSYQLGRIVYEALISNYSSWNNCLVFSGPTGGFYCMGWRGGVLERPQWTGDSFFCWNGIVALLGHQYYRVPKRMVHDCVCWTHLLGIITLCPKFTVRVSRTSPWTWTWTWSRTWSRLLVIIHRLPTWNDLDKHVTLPLILPCDITVVLDVCTTCVFYFDFDTQHLLIISLLSFWHYLRHLLNWWNID